MNRVVLFSRPGPEIFAKLSKVLFPDFIKNPVLAYMPSEGDNIEANKIYNPIWQQQVESFGANFVVIDNSKTGEEEKLLSANILMITGGNTFKLLLNLRKSGLDKAIWKFWKKDNVVVAGFSAGAVVLTPNIETANFGDPNEVRLTDLTALGIVDFEVWPHYEQGIDDNDIKKYKTGKDVEIKLIGDLDLIVLDISLQREILRKQEE